MPYVLIPMFILCTLTRVEIDDDDVKNGKLVEAYTSW